MCVQFISNVVSSLLTHRLIFLPDGDIPAEVVSTSVMKMINGSCTYNKDEENVATFFEDQQLTKDTIDFPSETVLVFAESINYYWSCCSSTLRPQSFISARLIPHWFCRSVVQFIPNQLVMLSLLLLHPVRLKSRCRLVLTMWSNHMTTTLLQRSHYYTAKLNPSLITCSAASLATVIFLLTLPPIPRDYLARLYFLNLW